MAGARPVSVNPRKLTASGNGRIAYVKFHSSDQHAAPTTSRAKAAPITCTLLDRFGGSLAGSPTSRRARLPWYQAARSARPTAASRRLIRASGGAATAYANRRTVPVLSGDTPEGPRRASGLHSTSVPTGVNAAEGGNHPFAPRGFPPARPTDPRLAIAMEAERPDRLHMPPPRYPPASRYCNRGCRGR
jgi:hypothetical protein